MPKAGIVMPTTSHNGLLSSFAQRAVTRSATVESRPPETPITALPPIVFHLFLRPATCIARISSHLPASQGTKGNFLILRVSPVALNSSVSTKIYLG